MLLPYNVERPARRTPVITYALMALNVFIYLLSTGYSNVRLYSDRPVIKAALGIDDNSETARNWIYEGVDFSKINPENPSDLVNPVVQRVVWTLQHDSDLFTLDVHPDTMQVLAYRAGAPSLLTILTSMFLHSDLEHLLGNMLFLWVFGRAVEDTMGQWLFLASYFVCGLAATLLYHLMTKTFAPSALLLPFLGASGAIAGVQGLFAPRFYRTPVRIFYVKIWAWPIFYPALALLSYILAVPFGLGLSGATFAMLIVLAATVVIGKDDLWGELRIAAVWTMSIWLVVWNILPALFQILRGYQGGGVAYWAHIGGFFCGVLYALLIGSHKDGETEYLVDDTRASLDNRFGNNAIESAQAIIKRKPNDPVGYQLLAEGHVARNDFEAARQNFAIAIGKYFEQGEATQAANLYVAGLVNDRDWLLPPALQMQVGAQLVKDRLWKDAAETIVKIPYHYPDAKEGELAFLRGAQLYNERLDQPMVAMELLHEFGKRYPNSQWTPQAHRAYQAARENYNAANNAPEVT